MLSSSVNFALPISTKNDERNGRMSYVLLVLQFEDKFSKSSHLKFSMEQPKDNFEGVAIVATLPTEPFLVIPTPKDGLDFFSACCAYSYQNSDLVSVKGESNCLFHKQAALNQINMTSSSCVVTDSTKSVIANNERELQIHSQAEKDLCEKDSELVVTND